MPKSLLPVIYSLLISMMACSGGVTLPDGQSAAPIQSNVALLRDEGGKLDLQGAIAHEGWQQVSDHKDLFPSYDSAAFWLRTTFSSDHPDETLWVILLQSNRWEELDWYTIRQNGDIVGHSAGNAREGPPGTYTGPLPNIILSLKTGEQVQLYLRARTRARGNLVLKAENLQRQPKINGSSSLMISFGALALLILLSFVLAVYGKRKEALAYTVCTIGIALNHAGLSGLAKSEQWPLSQFLSMGGSLFFAELGLLGSLYYLHSFFNLKDAGGWPIRIWRPLLILNLVILALVLFLPFPTSVRILHGHAFVHSAVCLLITVWSWRRGVRFAKFYLISWIVAWLPLVADSLSRESFLAVSSDLSYIVIIGSVLSQVFLFLSLAEKIRHLAREHKQNQKRLIEVERHQNERLEQQVKKRTASLEQARQDAEKANRYKDLFLANMSHEIRTPLSALIGLSQILVHEGEKEGLPQNFRRMLGKIKSGGTHLDLMLTNLMDAGAASHGKTPLQVAPFKPTEWAQSMKDVIEPLARAKSVSLHWENRFKPDAVFHQDAIRLSQILINLAHNSVKFSPTHEQVSVLIAPENNSLVIEVNDRGKGLPENPDLLFQMFQKNDTVLSDNQHGVGLGLHIVKISIQLLGGEITARNLPDQGASFRVVIPNSSAP